jgi:tetratricopeptide (TPR) repeat protein
MLIVRSVPSRAIVVAALLLLAACAAAPRNADGETAKEAAKGSEAASSDPQALIAEGDAALQRGDLPEAARAYRRAAEASDDEVIAEQATQLAFDHSQFRETLLSAQRWLAINPTIEDARRYAGVAALELHQIDEAESQFAALLETAFISPAAGYLSLLPVLAEHGTAPDVTELFRRLLTRHPDVGEGQYTLAAAALRGENFSLSLEHARRATEIAPYWTPARLLLARVLVASGQEEAGLAIARELAIAPDADVSTHLEYALMLASVGRDEEARALLTPYATGERVVPAAVRGLGMLDLQQRDLDAATKRFEELLSTGAMSYDALYFLGSIADRRDDPERALRYYSRVVGGDFALSAQGRVARIKAQQSGLDAGLAQLEEFARSQPQRGPDIVATRAGLASGMGDEKRAIEILDAGISQYPDVVDLAMARVFAYERVGRHDAAVKELRRLLEERPGDSVLQNALGYTLADQDRQLAEAQGLVSAALEQMPDSAAVLDSMGWVLYRQGRLPEALQYLERASELGEESEIHLHLGEVQWAMGDRDGARETWQQALERQPDNAQLKERLERAGP